MRMLALLGAVLGLSSTALAGDGGATLDRVRDAALQSDFAYRQLAILTDEIGPRLTGSAQAEAAVARVAAEMKRAGFDVALQPVWVPRWVRGDAAAALIDYPGRADGLRQDLVVIALGGSVATPPEGLRAPVLVVRSYEELEARKAEARGRIVLFLVRFDQFAADNGLSEHAYAAAVDYRGKGASAAARVGAVAALVRSVGGADYRLPHTGALWYQDDAPKIPAGALTAEDADLVARLAAKGPVTMHLTLTPRMLEPVRSHNVLVDLRGREKPGEIVIVSGHLDSWDVGTGAIDDGAGVAASLGALETIKRLELRPRRTLRAVAWMNEENGLCGAGAYARADPDAARTHVAVVESDAGAGRPLGIQANVRAEVLERLKPLSKALLPIGASIVDHRTESVGADISQLEDLGVPGFAPMLDTRSYFHYHHTPADTLDKVDPDDLKRQVATLATLAWWLADAEEPLPRNPPKPEKDRWKLSCPEPR